MGDGKDYDNRDFSDLSDSNRENLNKSSQNWNSAEAIRGNDGYNPHDLSRAENSSVSDSQPANPSPVESNHGIDSPFINNVKGGGTYKSRNRDTSRLNRAKKFFKSKGAMAAGSGALVGGGALFGILSFLITGLAPIHITEIFTEKSNWTASTLDIRGEKMLDAKLKKGVNCRAGGLFCRLSAVSDKQIAKLEAEGFKVNKAEAKTILGRSKISSLEFTSSTGEIIKIDNKTGSIRDMMRNPEIRSSFKKAYNGKFASFLDSSWKKVKSIYKFLKEIFNNKGKSASELKEEMDDKANTKAQGADIDNAKSQEESDAGNDADQQTKNKIKADADEEVNAFNNTKAVAKEIGEAGGGSAKVMTGVKKIFDKVSIVKMPCMVWSFGKFISLGMKLQKSIALAQFALSFLSFSHKIKAGHATSEEVENLGNTITGIMSEDKKDDEKTSKGENEGFIAKVQDAFKYLADTSAETKTMKSFTDSQGWKAMAYGDVITNESMNASTKAFSVGLSGVAYGVFRGFENFLASVTPGGKSGVKATCDTVLGIAGDLFEIGLEVGLAIFSGGASAIVWDAIKSAVGGYILGESIGAVVGELMQSLPGLLIGKVVDKYTTGEDAGNAVTSGVGSLMSKNTIGGGGGLLTKSEAVAMYQQNEIKIAKYGEEVRATTSPFDPTSHHTFLGSIFSSIMPYQSQIGSIAGIVPSLLGASARSLAAISPSASAANTAAFQANMEVCQDDAMKELGVATDIFCNPYAGISNTTLNTDSEEILNVLISNGQLEDTDDKEKLTDAIVKGSDLEKYVKNCTDRGDTPIGEGEEDKRCISGSESYQRLVPYFQAFMTDARVEDGMDNDMEQDGNVSDDSSSNSGTSFSGNAKNKDCNKGDLCWPIEGATAGSVTSGRWFHSGHKGYDFGAGGVTFGTPVYNIADGEVVAVGDKNIDGGISPGYGPDIVNGASSGGCDFSSGNQGGGKHVVVIKHTVNGRTFYSNYMHMQKNSDLKVGERIDAGTQVGEVGSMGCSTGAHLHFQMQDDYYNGNTAFDPKEVLGDLK